jgi:hypothetical protein
LELEETMVEAKTDVRIDWPTVMLIGTDTATPPSYVATLRLDGYVLATMPNADAARAKMAEVMPHVVIMSRAVPMPDHRIVHDTSAAVGAEVLLIPEDAHPEVVRHEVEIAVARTKKRRQKR